MRGWIGYGVVLTALTVALPAQADGKSTGTTATGAKATGAKAAVTGSARPSPEARAAKKRVDAVRAGAKGKKDEARTGILRQAAGDYAKMAVEFAGEPKVAAAACFSAAQLWRTVGELGKAKESYQQSITLDGARFTERSTLELAHLARLEKDVPASLALYTKVATQNPKSARAHEARVWIGRSHARASNPDAAITAYRSAVDLAASPTQTIDACNRLAGLLVKLNKLDEAEQVIARAATAAKSPPTGKGKTAERQPQSWAKAYERMSARRALQRVRDKAMKAHKDAVDIERRK